MAQQLNSPNTALHPQTLWNKRPTESDEEYSVRERAMEKCLADTGLVGACPTVTSLERLTKEPMPAYQARLKEIGAILGPFVNSYFEEINKKSAEQSAPSTSNPFGVPGAGNPPVEVVIPPPASLWHRFQSESVTDYQARIGSLKEFIHKMNSRSYILPKFSWDSLPGESEAEYNERLKKLYWILGNVGSKIPDELIFSQPKAVQSGPGGVPAKSQRPPEQSRPPQKESEIPA